MPRSLSFKTKVESTAGKVARQVGNLTLSQLPFATAKSLTQTAQLARDHVRLNMRRHFTTRSKRPARGVTIQAAQKRDWPWQKARVGTRDAFMAEHVTGKIRRPKKSKTLAVPTRLVKRTSTGKVRKAQKPRTILAKEGGHVESRQVRLRRPRARGQAKRVSIFFLLKREVKIRKRWPFQEEVNEKAAQECGAYRKP